MSITTRRRPQPLPARLQHQHRALGEMQFNMAAFFALGTFAAYLW
jgi:hypothetical protein